MTSSVWTGIFSIQEAGAVSGTVPWGIFAIGFVFGYLLYYAVKHTKQFGIEMLSAAIGAVGGATVIGLFKPYQDWIGPYGLGLGVGFVVYFVLVLIFTGTGPINAGTPRLLFFSRAILGIPKEGEEDTYKP
jgi:hypothetical protein